MTSDGAAKSSRIRDLGEVDKYTRLEAARDFLASTPRKTAAEPPPKTAVDLLFGGLKK
jgi:hypothetical protein